MMKSTIATFRDKLRKILRPIRHAYSVVFNRYAVKTSAVGIKYVNDYSDRYEWIAENIPDFKRSVWVNCSVKTYRLTKPHNLSTVTELNGEFRFKRQSDAVAFLMRWA